MTVWEVQAEYNRQYQANQEAYRAWDKAHQGTPYRDRPEFDGPKIDYNGLGEQLVEALQQEYGFTPAQASHVYSKAYEWGHSSFGDVFHYAAELADFVQNWPK